MFLYHSSFPCTIPFEWQESNLIRSVIELFTGGIFFGFDPNLRGGKEEMKIEERNGKRVKKDLLKAFGIVSLPLFSQSES